MEEIGKETPDILSQLRALPGVQFQSITDDNHVLHITDRNVWNAQVNDLGELFWPVIAEGRPIDDPQKQDWLEGTFKDADAVYLETNPREVVGTCCIARSPENHSVTIIRDISTHPHNRGKGTGERLFRAVFAGAKADTLAFIGAASNPSALKAQLNAAQAEGWNMSFGIATENNEYLIHLAHSYVSTEKYVHPESLSAGDDALVLFKPDLIYPISAQQMAYIRNMHSFSEDHLRILSKMFELQKTYLNDDGIPRAVIGCITTAIRNTET